MEDGILGIRNFLKAILAKNRILVSILCLYLIFYFSCTPEEEIITRANKAQLIFSEDTLFFDTLFTTIGSTTQWLTIYNQNKKAVEISTIELGMGNQSPYTLYVNGRQGSLFSNQLLLGGDSLLVLVEVTVDPMDQDLPFLVKDSLVFTVNGNHQNVKMLTWGQDAHFIRTLIIKRDTTLTANRPFVVYDSIVVDPAATLTIEAGSQLFFAENAVLIMYGNLQVQGTANQRVMFTNIRQDGAFEQALGQWQGLAFAPDSKQNTIAFATIRNAEFGIYKEGLLHADADSLQLTIASCIIENMSIGGILAFNAHIKVYNTLVDNCVGYVVGNFAGGNYSYQHCTLANSNSNRQFIRQGPVIEFTDTTGTASVNPLHVVLENNIIWGNLPNELVLEEVHEGFTSEIKNNLIKTKNPAFEADNNLLNTDPEFINPEAYNYHLDTSSQAIDKGIILKISTDLDGNARDTLPDLGAYEFIKE